MIHIVNPTDRSWTRNRWILWFGQNTRLMVWGNSLDVALDEAIDWIADNAPGLLADDAVAAEYAAAMAEGLTEEEAIERAEADTTIGGNYGHYVHSWEWGITAENPTRAEVLELTKSR